ncbi:MAG: YihY/virulence factor BrkB family protein [Gemmatimonadota bacterium]
MWYRSVGGFIQRTLQAADETNVPFLANALTFDAALAAVPFFLLIVAGVTHFSRTAAVGAPSPLEWFLPPHNPVAGSDPFATIELLLVKIGDVARGLSIYAVPAFIWFSTRLFSGIRTALNEIYDVSIRPSRTHFLVRYLFAKLRDLGMVVLTVLLFLANTTLSAGLGLIQAYGQRWPQLEFFLTRLGRGLGEAFAFLFLITLFFVLYNFAALRRPPWRATLVGSLFSAFLFEAAKRLFGLYIEQVFSHQRFTVDVNVAAVSLFVLWLYYSALVFLLGGVVAETWELRELRRKQRVV